MLKTTVLIAPLLAMGIATAAVANDNVSNVRVFHHTKTIHQPIKTEEYVCNTVDVPVYGESQGSVGDFLTGAIIGGLIGGTASNSDKGAAIGAFTGGVIAAEKGKKQIIGYRQKEVCNTEVIYIGQESQVYSHSTIRFYMNGKRYVLQFQR